MELRFNWSTDKIASDKREALENDIWKYVPAQYEECMGNEPECLEISLHDSEEEKIVLQGSVYKCDDAAKTEIMKIKVDSGFLVQCKGTALFTPDSSLEK